MAGIDGFISMTIGQVSVAVPLIRFRGSENAVHHFSSSCGKDGKQCVGEPVSALIAALEPDSSIRPNGTLFKLYPVASTNSTVLFGHEVPETIEHVLVSIPSVAGSNDNKINIKRVASGLLVGVVFAGMVVNVEPYSSSVLIPKITHACYRSVV